MKFKLRIWHLLLVLSLTAVWINWCNEASFSTVKIRVISVHDLPDSSFPLLSNMDGDYCMLIDFPGSRPTGSAYASARYGRSSVFKTTVTKENCELLAGRDFEFRYRAKKFLWLKPASVLDTISLSFDAVKWSETPLEWQTTR